ncbi:MULTISPECIES: hypothetical protein [Stenotrophomonas]|jgi:hypothetical protein|uniref:hypothetical protein n=1 Tax=Stenotrophomonas TaxID=40323 RepID=UPI00201D26CE|nr:MULTISPECIES: hypothetical protein [Stenotrophomonas]MBN5026314.1 hypothetical protein [Stenotrophomonas maltophilia]MDH1273444.1 hypothetical protein [Stenotrophomonas sp. GD03937]MDH1486214.1 hypothetical protein [Stenotrophomonas sp. GD03712]UQY96920.1 hypothetical protein LZ605_06040 [Stenotrophomonas maltophilia]WON70536.1 hypothetical protein RWT08_09480 [Stenotrophomonas maltophilia]
MKRLLCCLLLSAAVPLRAEPMPPPMQQLDFPVLAVGDIGQFRVRVECGAVADLRRLAVGQCICRAEPMLGCGWR